MSRSPEEWSSWCQLPAHMTYRRVTKLKQPTSHNDEILSSVSRGTQNYRNRQLGTPTAQDDLQVLHRKWQPSLREEGRVALVRYSHGLNSFSYAHEFFAQFFGRPVETLQPPCTRGTAQVESRLSVPAACTRSTSARRAATKSSRPCTPAGPTPLAWSGGACTAADRQDEGGAGLGDEQDEGHRQRTAAAAAAAAAAT